MVSFRDKKVQDEVKALEKQGKHIAAAFHSYMVACFGARLETNVSEHQRVMMRQSFFAGAQALMATLVTGANESDDEDETKSIIETVNKELLDFYKEFIDV